ncbi:MAG: hypothetical protein R3F34_20175 [Planctomycetota bacterium]
MVAWSALLVPALLSSVLVFVASSLIHMVVQWHRSEYRTLPDEDAVRAVTGRETFAPGKYVVPFCKDGKEMGSPEMQKKFEDGPNLVMYVRPNGAMKLGPFLGSWFAYSVAVSLLAGYLARATTAPGAAYLGVFRGRRRRRVARLRLRESCRSRSGWASRGRARSSTCSTG